MFTSLGDLVGTAGDEAIDAFVASIAPVHAEAREVRGEEGDSCMWLWPQGHSLADTRAAMNLASDTGITFGEAMAEVRGRRAADEANAMEEALALAEGDEDVALDMLGEEYGMWPEGPRW